VAIRTATFAAWRVALLATGLGVALYYSARSTTQRDVVYLAFGVASVVGITAGIRTRRPAHAARWLALAASGACFVVGDAILDYYDVVARTPAPFPSVADGVYLAGYPLLVAAVVGLTRSGSRGHRREDRLDAAIVAVGAFALLWQVLMTAYVHDGSASALAKLIGSAYPIMDVGVLFIVVQAIFASRARNAAATLVAVAIAAMMIADVGYDLTVLHGSYQVGSPLDAGWLLNYGLLAAAALHPAMAAPLPVPANRAETRRLPVIALAGFVPPAILLVAELTGTPADEALLAGLSIVTLALAMLRVGWLLRRQQAQALSLRDRSQQLQDALTAQGALQHDLRHQAFHDALTGLANRALLHDRLEHALLAAARSARNVTLIFCDLDGFKTINDSLGHDVGDALLVTVGKRLTSVVRAEDTVARLGGDEFAVLMDDIDPDAAMATAERIVSEVRQPIEGAEQNIRMSVSVGVSFGHAAKTADALFSEADAAMYAAKTKGKDRVEAFEEHMRSTALREMTLRNSFEEGLRNEEFYLLYQPQVSLRTGRLEGFEALARWRHPVYGEISPGEFIPLAEATGFIVPLGRWALETACVTAATWLRSDAPPLAIAVNVSARQLQNAQIFNDVTAALGYSGLQPTQLVLEVTESMLAVDTVGTAATLSRLRALGVRIAIDDFGTGYSSLSQLQRFPADILKIDKSFVDPLLDLDGEAVAFVATIIGLARQLRLNTIAEGIEDVSQQKALRNLGCESAQGFLFARPVTEFAARRIALVATEQLLELTD
jgi:diguanylate cyclase